MLPFILTGGVPLERSAELTLADILGEDATADESGDEEGISARGDKSEGTCFISHELNSATNSFLQNLQNNFLPLKYM